MCRDPVHVGMQRRANGARLPTGFGTDARNIVGAPHAVAQGSILQNIGIGGRGDFGLETRRLFRRPARPVAPPRRPAAPRLVRPPAPPRPTKRRDPLSCPLLGLTILAPPGAV